jgi:serine/threonine protein kinase
MKMFNHSSVVSVKDMLASTNRIFLILDLMSGGNMKYKLLKEDFLNENELIFYFRQFFSALDYIHSMGVTHGNLRLENILLHTNRNLKITDFR